MATMIVDEKLFLLKRISYDITNSGGYYVVSGLPFYVGLVHVDGVLETNTSSSEE